MSVIQQGNAAVSTKSGDAEVRTDGSPNSPPNQVPRKQLSLRALFFCVTYFAISSALALRFGLGIFVMMNGICLTWLSFRGYLWWLQTNKSRPKLFGLAWVLFGVSFLLPVTMMGCSPPKPVYGWQVALETADSLVECPRTTWQIVVDPTHRTWSDAWRAVGNGIGGIILNLPNAIMLISPFVLYRMQRGRGKFLTSLYGCAAVTSWMWGFDADLLVGYYVWSVAVSLPFLGQRPGWRTLITMIIFGLAILGFVFSIEWWESS